MPDWRNGHLLQDFSICLGTLWLKQDCSLGNRSWRSDLEQGLIYPPLAEIRHVSAVIGAAVARVAYRQGLATQPEPDDLLAHVQAQMYVPTYRDYV